MEYIFVGGKPIKLYLESYFTIILFQCLQIHCSLLSTHAKRLVKTQLTASRAVLAEQGTPWLTRTAHRCLRLSSQPSNWADLSMGVADEIVDLVLALGTGGSSLPFSGPKAGLLWKHGYCFNVLNFTWDIKCIWLQIPLTQLSLYTSSIDLARPDVCYLMSLGCFQLVA